MTITKSLSNPISVTLPVRIQERIVEDVALSEPVYNRILVILDESTATEQALRTTVALARKHHAEIVMISGDTPGSNAYIERICRSLMEQDIKAHGYTIGTSLKQIPSWLLNNEQADVIIVAQQQVGWLGQLFGQDIASTIRNLTSADVIEVCS